jgi:cytochrome c oxidase assembly protein subunit 23
MYCESVIQKMNNTHDYQSFKEKESSKFLDPCRKESINSMKCLDENNYDKGKCKDLFTLYRECKKKWVSFC